MSALAVEPFEVECALWLPGTVYRRKRAKVLMSFLDRPRIYQFEPLADRFEANARRNVAEAVRTLTETATVDKSD